MNSNEKYQEILDEYGTFEAYKAVHRALSPKDMEPWTPPTTWSEIILDIILHHDASSAGEILDKLEELYNPPTPKDNMSNAPYTYAVTGSL